MLFLVLHPHPFILDRTRSRAQSLRLLRTPMCASDTAGCTMIALCDKWSVSASVSVAHQIETPEARIVFASGHCAPYAHQAMQEAQTHKLEYGGKAPKYHCAVSDHVSCGHGRVLR